MEEQDDRVPQDEQAIRDQIDDEIVNQELMECLDAGSRPHREGKLTGRRATSGGFFCTFELPSNNATSVRMGSIYMRRNIKVINLSQIVY